MKEQEEFVLRTLKKVGAVITNSHIVYTNGGHGSAYVNKDAIYPHTSDTSLLCQIIAGQFSDDDVDVVIAPAVGGVILSQWTAYHLSKITGHEILGTYAEQQYEEKILLEMPQNSRPLFLKLPFVGDNDGLSEATLTAGQKIILRKPELSFVIKRGYDKLVTGKNVLVVEDVLTTGGSVKKVIEITQAIGGNVIGVGVLCNRGGITTQDIANPPKLFSLINVTLDAWEEKDCPLCKQNVPINVDVGKGRQYLASKKVS